MKEKCCELMDLKFAYNNEWERLTPADLDYSEVLGYKRTEVFRCASCKEKWIGIYYASSEFLEDQGDDWEDKPLSEVDG